MPKYQGTKEHRYWENAKDYIKNPKYTSQLFMQQDRKYFAKNDEMLLGDTSVNQNPVIDSFKATHVPLPRPKEVSEKAMTVNYLPASKMPKHKYPRPTKPRWTEIEIKYGGKGKSKGRFNDVQ